MSHSDCEIESGDVEIETLELNYSNSKENVNISFRVFKIDF